MNIIVCIKHVPKVSEEELFIRKDGLDIEKTELIFDINEWDLYAVEEAVRLKEKFNAKVTVVTVAAEEAAEESLRKSLALGADEAVLIFDKKIQNFDPFCVSRILHKLIKNMEPVDIILTGAQASDDGYAVAGVTLATMLGLPYATLVNKIDVEDNCVIVNRELENNMNEVLRITLPALFTIQTGINEPRYVSIMGIRKAKNKEIKALSADDLQLSQSDMDGGASKIFIEKMYLPESKSRAIFLSGSADEVSSKLVLTLQEKGCL